jgi:hypothetical protein
MRRCCGTIKQAQHGTESALEWCRTQGLEPPALEHLGRIIRSAVYHFETHHQEGIFARMSDVSEAAIDHPLATEETESATPEPDDNEAVSKSIDHTFRQSSEGHRFVGGRGSTVRMD